MVTVAGNLADSAVGVTELLAEMGDAQTKRVEVFRDRLVDLYVYGDLRGSTRTVRSWPV